MMSRVDGWQVLVGGAKVWGEGFWKICAFNFEKARWFSSRVTQVFTR